MNRLEILNNLGDYGEAEFNVSKVPLFRPNQIVDKFNQYPNMTYTPIDTNVALVRTDTNETLSIVGSKYNPVTHQEAFKTAEDVILRSDLNLEGIDRHTAVSHNGARAYSTWTLPEHRVTLRKDDDVALQISARNSYDGSWSFVVEVGGLRFICLNMQVFANNFAIHKSKHTKGLNLDRIASRLSDSVMFYDKETELWRDMVDTKVTDRQAMEILARLSGSKPAESYSKQYSDYGSFTNILYEPDVIRNKTLLRLYDFWQNNSQKLDKTAWALYNSMTEWATHGDITKKSAIGNIASIKVDRLEKVRKTLNNKMLPMLGLAQV